MQVGQHIDHRLVWFEGLKGLLVDRVRFQCLFTVGFDQLTPSVGGILTDIALATKIINRGRHHIWSGAMREGSLHAPSKELIVEIFQHSLAGIIGLLLGQRAVMDQIDQPDAEQIEIVGGNIKVTVDARRTLTGCRKIRLVDVADIKKRRRITGQKMRDVDAQVRRIKSAGMVVPQLIELDTASQLRHQRWRDRHLEFLQGLKKRVSCHVVPPRKKKTPVLAGVRG